MVVLFWTSTIPTGSGRLLAFPIGVPDDDLEAFGDRLTREGGAMVERLWTEQRDDGCAYITRSERMFVSIAGTATLRDYHVPVRREID